MSLKQTPQKSISFFRAGFTIVELLIVIVVVAILAAIVIVAYNGVSRSAARSVLHNDASQSTRLLQNYRTDNTTFPANLAALTTGLPQSGDTTYEYTATSTTFCLTASSVRAQQSYYVTEDNIIRDGTCSGHLGHNPPPLQPDDMLSVGYYSNCTLAFDEQPYCWGNGGDGQLGNNTTVNATTPSAVDLTGALSGKRVTAISSGYDNSCAIASGAVYCWGGQTHCQIGVDICTSFSTSHPDVLIPTAVTTTGILGGKTVTKVSVGSHHACVLASNDLICWGEAQWGKIGGNFGSSASTTTSLPRSALAGTVLAGSTITDFDAGASTTCAVANGAAYCWGADSRGQLGNGADDSGLMGAGTYINHPLAVDTSGVLAGKTVTDIDSGSTYETTCAVADGAVYCWGRGIDGQLGNGVLADSESPVAVSTAGVLNGKTVTDIDVSDNEHVCAIADGAAYCWGSNVSYGMLGDGTTTSPRSTPVAVNTAGVLSGKTLVSIQTGYYTTCALSSDRRVYCWGRNNSGQLGNGTTTNSSLPVTVTDPTP